MANEPTATSVPAEETKQEPTTVEEAADGDKMGDGKAEQSKGSGVNGTSTDQDEMTEANTNGHVDATKPTTASSDPSNEDDEIHNAEESTVVEAEAPADAVLATPVTSKTSGNGSSKKRSSVIPEHRARKLNRRKSRATLRLDAKPGQMYLARLKGHQPWPSLICDEDMLPASLLNTRPVTTTQADGTFKKAEYADGGKRVNERTFPIMFLHTNEFAWIPNTEISPLSAEECQDVDEKHKSKALLAAYKVGAEGHDLDFFKQMLADHEKAVEEDRARKAEIESKKAAKSKRKSGAADEDAGDEMEVDEEATDPKPKSKKRKKSLEGDGTDDKPAKTPKTSGPKLKLTTPKTPTEASSKKKTPKSRPSARKSAAKADESDEDMEDAPKVEEKPLTPAEAKEKKEKEIRYYRHKLQKGFLSRDTVPADDEIKSMSGFLAKLETYTDLEGSIIRATKINKVLKAMLRLSSIPQDDEYQFKKRSHDLLAAWNSILSQDPSAGADDKDGDKDGDEAGKPDEPATNGTSKAAGKPAAGQKDAKAKANKEAAAESQVKADEAQDEDETDKAANTTSDVPEPAEELSHHEPGTEKISDHRAAAEPIEAAS